MASDVRDRTGNTREQQKLHQGHRSRLRPHAPPAQIAGPLARGLKELPGLAELGFQGCHLVYQAVVLLFGRLRIGLFRLTPIKSCCHKERLGVKLGKENAERRRAH